MITLSAIGTWLVSFAGGAIVKLVLDGFSRWLAQRQASKTERELGAAEAKLDQAAGTIAAQGAELDALANAPQNNDEAMRRLEEGSA